MFKVTCLFKPLLAMEKISHDVIMKYRLKIYNKKKKKIDKIFEIVVSILL